MCFFFTFHNKCLYTLQQHLRGFTICTCEHSTHHRIQREILYRSVCANLPENLLLFVIWAISLTKTKTAAARGSSNYPVHFQYSMSVMPAVARPNIVNFKSRQKHQKTAAWPVDQLTAGWLSVSGGGAFSWRRWHFVICAVQMLNGQTGWAVQKDTSVHRLSKWGCGCLKRLQAMLLQELFQSQWCVSPWCGYEWMFIQILLYENCVQTFTVLAGYSFFGLVSLLFQLKSTDKIAAQV